MYFNGLIIKNTFEKFIFMIENSAKREGEG
jgi:hypothetical protein